MIRAAVVGLGWWGQVLARAIHEKSDAIRIVRGITRTPSKVEDFAAETGLPIDSDFEAMLADPDIDAVILATPHSQHASQIAAAAAAGKHVFCEKPITLDAGEADQAFAACERAGVVLAVGQNRRFLPAVQRIRSLLDDGTLGQLLHMEGNFSGPSGYRHQPGVWRASSAESPAGGMTGKGLHLTDLMISFAGPPTEIDARSLRQHLQIEMDDTTIMLMRFRNGPTGYLGTLTATADVFRLQVFGTKGTAELRGHEHLIVTGVHEKPVETVFDKTSPEKAELEAFAAAIQSGTPYPVTREQAVANIRLLQGITRSAKAGGPVSL